MAESVEFRPGDEVEWREQDKRVRGRVFVDDADGKLYVQSYDALKRLKGSTRVLDGSPGVSHASAIDLIAEKVPDRYHLVASQYAGEEPTPACRCGALDRDGKLLRPVDATIQHHVAVERTHDVWHQLIDGTARALDADNREPPLDERPISKSILAEADDVKLCGECFRLAVLARCWPADPSRCTKDELLEFVQAWLGGRVFSHLHVRSPHDVPMVFMCMMLSAPMPLDYAEKVGLIWEYIDQAGPRSVNGNPCFFSHRFMHADDWARVLPVIEAEEKRRDDLSIPDLPTAE